MHDVAFFWIGLTECAISAVDVVTICVGILPSNVSEDIINHGWVYLERSSPPLAFVG